MTDTIDQDQSADQSNTARRKASVWTKVPVVKQFMPPEAFITDGVDASEDANDAGELAPWDVPGGMLRPAGARNARRAKAGWYGPSYQGAPSTTRQGEILTTAHFGAPTGFDGIVNGRDTLTRTAFSHDPITAYRNEHGDGSRKLTSPNVIIIGDVGSGKSSYTKTVYVERPLILRKRRCVVLDKKPLGDEGEYAELTRQMGNESFRFLQDGTGEKLNLLDRLISRSEAGVKGQTQLLTTAVRLARPYKPYVDEWEDEALRLALRDVYRLFEGRRDPVLADLASVCGAVQAPADYSAAATERLHQAGLSLRSVFHSLLQTYGGVFDGETSNRVDLTHKLTTFDISQLPADGPAIPIVMAATNMWLMGRLTGEKGWATNVVYEEGWHMIGGPSVELIKSNEKLSRSLGMSNVFIMHKGTDIPPESAGITVLQEAQTAHIFNQGKYDDAAWAQRVFNLDPDTTGVVMDLDPGHCVTKIASAPETEVEHIRSEWETVWTDTDQAMMGDTGATDVDDSAQV